MLDKPFIKNIMNLLTATVVSKLMLMATVIVGARWLGPEAWGQFAYAFTLLYLMQVLSDFGFHTLTMREVAANRLCLASYRRIVLLRLLLGALGLLLVSIYTLLSSGMHIFFITLILGVSVFFRAKYATIRSVLQGQERMSWTIAIDCSLYGGFLVIALVGFLIGHDTSLVLPFAWLFGSMLCMLIAIKANIRLSIASKFQEKITDVDLLKRALPFVMVNILVVLFHRIGIILLQSIRGNEEVGLYAAGYQFFDALALIPGLLVTVIFPRMVKNKGGKTQNVHKIAATVSMTTLLPALIISLMSSTITEIVYGAEYKAVGELLPLLMLGLPFMAATAVYAHYLFVHKRERISALSTATALLFNIGLNLVLIPDYGMYAVALVTALSLFLNTTFHFLIIQYVLKKDSVKNLNLIC